MLQFRVYDVDLQTKLDSLKQFMDDVYYRYYKKPRDKKRYKRKPELKVTEDIISVKFWTKTKDGLEKRIILDGTILINDVKLHTLTIDGEKFEEIVVQEFIYILKKLTKISIGFIYTEVNHIPIRIEYGEVKKFIDLLEEIFDDLPDEKKKEHALSLSLLATDSYGISL